MPARPRLPLAGRTVVVTGAAKGIGAATARVAHARGASVAVLDVDGVGAQRLAHELGARTVGVQADVRDAEALDAAVARVRDAMGGVDVLVANAGVAPPTTTVRTIDPADFERTVEIDLLGQWRTIRAALPDVVDRRGHVVAISSIYAFFNGVLNASYAVSKAGLEALVRALRAELAPHGATAGVAYFGFVATDLVDDAFARPQVATFRRALPAFLTRPIPVEVAARALVDGIEARAPRVVAPAWVRAALALRGLTDPLADRVIAHRAAPAVRQAEASGDGG